MTPLLVLLELQFKIAELHSTVELVAVKFCREELALNDVVF